MTIRKDRGKVTDMKNAKYDIAVLSGAYAKLGDAL